MPPLGVSRPQKFAFMAAVWGPLAPSCPLGLSCSESSGRSQESPRETSAERRDPEAAAVRTRHPPHPPAPPAAGICTVPSSGKRPQPRVPGARAPRRRSPAAWSPRHPRTACARRPPLQDTGRAGSARKFPGAAEIQRWPPAPRGSLRARGAAASPPPPPGPVASDPAAEGPRQAVGHPPPCCSSRSRSWTPAKALARLVLPTPGSPSSTTRYWGSQQPDDEPEDSEDQLPRGAAALPPGSEDEWPSWGCPGSVCAVAAGAPGRGRGVLALLRSGLLLPRCVFRVIGGTGGSGVGNPEGSPLPCGPRQPLCSAGAPRPCSPEATGTATPVPVSWPGSVPTFPKPS